MQVLDITQAAEKIYGIMFWQSLRRVREEELTADSR
jgi:hypothetical protein